MCRFVAFISTKNENIDPYFNFLKNQAENGKRSPHPDGFGIWIKNDDGEFIYKSTAPVWKANLNLPTGNIAFLHARKKGKTGAPVSILNVHPFIHDNAVFMHNGILEIGKHPKSLGNTDTESFFLTILDMGVERGLKHIVTHYKFESLNFVMYKNDSIYVFRMVNTLENYFTVYLKKSPTNILISTEKDNSAWDEVKNGELIKISSTLEMERYCIFPDRCH